MKLFNFMPIWARKIYVRYKLTRLYDKAVESAENEHSRIKEMVYVVPDIQGMPMLLTKQGFKDAKKAKVFKSTTTMNDIKKICIYHTGAEYNRDMLEPKEREERRDGYINMMLQEIFKTRK